MGRDVITLKNIGNPVEGIVEGRYDKYSHCEGEYNRIVGSVSNLN